uniref:PDZ domain-containing protein n=1 Tax=Terrapene triunguis TaxID=2587831 RepID=A0A674JKS7_9SAUR
MGSPTFPSQRRAHSLLHPHQVSVARQGPDLNREGLAPLQVVKDANGLRFSLDGGRGSLQGDRPLTVKKIFQGGPKDLLQPGDEVLQIEERSLQGLMRLEAWQLIRALPVGPVQLLVRKKAKP